MKWRWMEGMRSTTGERVLASGGARSGPPAQIIAYISSGFLSDMSTEQPDWTDPATIGCLLAQVRELYPRAWTMYVDDKWYVMTIVADEWTTVSARKTEADALLAALKICDWPH